MSGFKDLARGLQELSDFSKSLDGQVAEVKFDPSDPASVQRAVAEMERNIDDKAARYSSNDAVRNIARDLKAQYKNQIEQLAAKRRQTEL